MSAPIQTDVVMPLHAAISAFLALHLLPTALLASPVPEPAVSSPKGRLLTPKDLRVKTRAPAAAPAAGPAVAAAAPPLDERDIDFDPTRNELGKVVKPRLSEGRR